MRRTAWATDTAPLCRPKGTHYASLLVYQGPWLRLRQQLGSLHINWRRIFARHISALLDNRKKRQGTQRTQTKKEGCGFVLQRWMEHLPWPSFPLGSSIRNKNVPFLRCTISEDFGLVFRWEKRRYTNFVQSRLGRHKKERKQVYSCFLSKRLIRYSAG